MTSDETIIALLTDIRDAQREALENQRRAIAGQEAAFARQTAHLQLYRGVVLLVVPLIAALGYLLYRLAAPQL